MRDSDLPIGAFDFDAVLRIVYAKAMAAHNSFTDSSQVDSLHIIIL